ncbi:MAG: protein phosphatase 2C domain-containing protein [Pseudomonadota bacterium]|jgi:serine/threonine protein phosphatase PrpC|uniref:PP2C family protein-serine/threonine phosphatase n=1 Tax=Curvibacter delicatus TaxID=80879 RepID=UPI000837A709|nr:protein phosphatase 2C domain-containing protein [Curvibacter delicatus]MEA3393715.1 protein phosphatase 2C domain-containing protein [Pseudomonadota bacterium]
MRFSVYQVSRKGGREMNEDRMGYCYTRNTGLFLLADGMGGHPEGEIAAQMTLQVMAAMFQKEARPEIADPRAFLASAVMAAHRQILRYAAEKGMLDSPRTTVVAALIQGGSVTWVHCGDSRLYMVRDGEMLARTRDHSYMEQRQDEVPLTKAGEKINRNILFTCLGSPANPVFDITGPVSLQQGDKILLCSDGLWGSLSDVEIVYDLGLKPVSHAVPDLVEKALAKAGTSSDNVTVIALEWETPDAFEATQGGVTTDSINEGVFASTVQASLLDNVVEDLDDEAIERSIAEINEAIRRTAARRGSEPKEP